MTNIAKNYSYKNSLIPEAKVETQNYGCIFYYARLRIIVLIYKKNTTYLPPPPC
jgi:hypothetical protein